MKPRGGTRLRVTVTDARGRASRHPAARGLAAWLAGAAPRRARGEVAIALISDSAMRSLNRRHRAVDKSTDVLSFPAEPPLGDIAIATGVAARQALEFGHSARTECRILALHGLLHLLGYDHEADRGQMERIEEQLRRRAGLPCSLVTRSSRSHRSAH